MILQQQECRARQRWMRFGLDINSLRGTVQSVITKVEVGGESRPSLAWSTCQGLLKQELAQSAESGGLGLFFANHMVLLRISSSTHMTSDGETKREA